MPPRPIQLLLMATLLSSLLLLLPSLSLLFSSTTTAAPLVCRATRFPSSCDSSLPSSSDQVPTLHLLLAAVNASARSLPAARSMSQSLLSSAGRDKARANAAANCLEFLSYSDHRTGLTLGAVAAGRIKDARAWMSAALLFQYDCWSALKYVNTTRPVAAAMIYLAGFSEVTSNALSMLAAYDRFGEGAAAWRPPETERDGVWEDMATGGAPAGRRLNFPAAGEAKATVCKEGCEYASVQAAVEAAPANVGAGEWFTIHVKEGVYEERVRVGLEKTRLVLLGDGVGKTVITGSLNADVVGVTTYNTPTVGIIFFLSSLSFVYSFLVISHFRFIGFSGIS